MKLCDQCPFRHQCRVPHDLTRFHKVCTRMEEQGRDGGLLHDRLRYYLDLGECLVERGHVDL